MRDFVEWDVPTWSAAIRFWDSFLLSQPPSSSARALEVGAHYGGLSLYLAARHNIRTICTDLRDPGPAARPKHEAFAVTELVTYEAVDALAMSYSDASFDYVIFKSVLGEVAPRSRPENKPRMMSEVFRVLKPGGGRTLCREHDWHAASHRGATAVP
jgi:ubiquinone/menaquinone biosynthesis C-methylase UbiE